jgi:hypothetical protein
VYPHQALLDDVQIDSVTYVVVKVDLVHENVKNIKLELPLDDTMLALWDAITRTVYWRRISIDVDPSVAVLASNTASQPHTAPGLIFPEAQADSPIRDHWCPSSPRTQSFLPPAPNQTQPPSAPKKNVRAKSKSERKSSKVKKGKQPL